MSALTTWIKNLIYANVWVSANVLFITLTSTFSVGLKSNTAWLFFSFFSTLLAYNFQRIVKFPQLQTSSERNTWLRNNKNLLFILTAIGFLGSSIALFFLPIKIWVLLLLPAAMSFFYVVPLKSKKRSLREVPFLKIYLIALSWVFVAVFVPLYMASQSLRLIISMFLEKTFFVLAVTIPFDIRDMPFDSPIKKTIPQVIGVKRALIVAILFLLLSCAIAIVLFQQGYYSLGACIGLIISYVISGLVITRSGIHRRELFYTGIIDGLFFLQFCLVFFFTNVFEGY